MRRHRSRLTFANVCSFLALLIAIGTGGAYAANTVFSSDIVDGEVKSADIGNNQVKTADVRDDALSGGGLTGADIQNQSGVDTCTHGTTRFGELCAVVPLPGQQYTWNFSVGVCADRGLRLPSLGEAKVLAKDYDPPNLDPGKLFWTEELYFQSPALAWVIDGGNGSHGTADAGVARDIVCVTTPTN
jgi:hypothetical protein